MRVVLAISSYVVKTGETSSDHTDEDMIEVNIESRSRKSLAVLSLDENTTVRQLKIAFNSESYELPTGHKLNHRRENKHPSGPTTFHD